MDVNPACPPKKPHGLVAKQLEQPFLSIFTPVGNQCNNPTCRQLLVDQPKRCPLCGSAGLEIIYNFYDVLQVSHRCSIAELRSQYKKLSLQHHPDVTSGEQEKFLIIKQAYESLQHPQKRQEHDHCLRQLQQIRKGCFGAKPRQQSHIFWEEFSHPFFEEMQRIQKIRHTCGVLGSILGLCCSILSGGSFFLLCASGYMIGSFFPQMGRVSLLLCNILVFLIAVRFSIIALQTGSLLLVPVLLLGVHWYIKNVPKWERELE